MGGCLLLRQGLAWDVWRSQAPAWSSWRMRVLAIALEIAGMAWAVLGWRRASLNAHSLPPTGKAAAAVRMPSQKQAGVPPLRCRVIEWEVEDQMLVVASMAGE